MADRHCGVLADQQQSDRHADDIRAAEYHSIGALDLDAGFFEQVDTSIGSAGDEQRVASLLGQAADVDGREAVHVLFDVDQGEDTFLVDMGRHGQLHENAADRRVGVQTPDQLLHLFLGCIRWQMLADRAHAQLLAGPALRRHVGRRIRPLSHQDGCQSRRLLPCRYSLRDRRGDFFTHLLCN